ncbi:hypothetical protein Tco_1525312 [Tanacetum coccineum]
MQSSEQSNVVNHSETKITSDSNIIPYSQYVIESQQAAVQNSNSSAQQDALILSVIEQLKTQVVNCTKINLDNKSVNDTLTAELERYKEQVKVLKEGQNVDLKKKESLMQTVTLLKNDFKKEESRNIDREIALEKRIKQLDNIKAQQLELKLYDGNLIKNTSDIVILDSEETLMLAEESHFETRFVSQTELSAEQAFWSQNSMNSPDPTLSSRPTKFDVPKELPKVSMVNTSLKKLKHHLAGFDVVVKERTTAIAITEGSKLKGKALVDNAVTKHTIDPEMLKNDVEPITPKLLNNRTAHSAYIKHTHEEAVVLTDLVEHVKANYPLDHPLEYACRPTGRTFTIVGNACPLTRITTTTEVPIRKPTTLDNETSKPVVTLVYSRKPRKSKTNVPVSKSKVVQIVLWYLDSGCSKHMTGDRSQLTNFVNKFLGTVKFRNDHMAKILGYGDYQIGNVTISRVYYVEGLGHNLFFVGQFCDSNLEVAFRQHTCFIRNLEGVDLLTGS